MNRKKKFASCVHIRRCHICGGITESDGQVVSKCGHCGKAMAPFYFFNEAETAPATDSELRPPSIPGDRSPVRGLTAIW
ncbi:MAG: hypothetical protein AAB250_13590 [Bdellovibrionota bacterium]